jgi:hypothetical protein
MERKTEVSGIYKVSEGVLINKDNNSLKAYKMRKLKDRRVENIEEELSGLRQDMEEIKALLRGLVK